MKRFGKKYSWVPLLLFFVTLGLLSCAGGTPPASIPAPVASQINASEPDGTGAVTVVGGVGAAQPNATIEAANTSAGGSLSLLDLLIPPALAQTFEVTTTATQDGSFNFLIDGASGDIIAIRQIVNGEYSDPVEILVP